MNYNFNGFSQLTNDVECENLTVNGLFKATGNIKTEKFSNNGISRFSKNLDSLRLHSNGILKVTGKLTGKDITLEGLVNANCIMSDTCKVRGRIFVPDLVNCDYFSAHIESRSKIGNIEGDEVNITVSQRGFFKITLSVSSISAQSINLEGVICDCVEGDKVIIGRNCVIKNVSYKSELTIHEHAKVLNKQKIEER